MKRFLLILLAGLLLIAFSACEKSPEKTDGTDAVSATEESKMTTEGAIETNATETESSATTESEIVSETDSVAETEAVTDDLSATPADKARIVLANDEVYGWWSQYKFSKTDSDPFYRHEDIYYPNSVTFDWEAKEDADYYRLFISTDEGFAEDKTESYLLNTNSLTLDHLYVGTKYYWFVVSTGVTESGEEVNTTAVSRRSFTTEDSPRCLKIEGVSNTRDIGGMKTVDGKRIKQGMVYRGGKLEDITDEGKSFFLNYVGIKTDLDLRTPGEGGAGGVSPLGEDINYVNIDGRYYVGSKGISNDLGKELFAQEIRLFTDPDNYPIYIHCSLGRDRTGTLAMVIEGLLGVNKNILMMDYELSVFSVTGTLDNAGVAAIRNNISSTYDYLNGFEGSSFAEKVENYLLSIGITADEIQAIRDILLEEGK